MDETATRPVHGGKQLRVAAAHSAGTERFSTCIFYSFCIFDTIEWGYRILLNVLLKQSIKVLITLTLM